MGYYYGPSEPPPDKEQGGCRDALILTRAVFGVLFWPLIILFGTIVALVLLFYLFSIFWLFGVLALVAVGAAVGLYARWERHHYMGPGGR